MKLLNYDKRNIYVFNCNTYIS